MQIPNNAYLVNMYIAPMEADDNAPSAVTNMQLAFEGEQTTGTVSFKMPTTTYAGEELSGDLSYNIISYSFSYTKDYRGNLLIIEIKLLCVSFLLF